jgi:predicted outer membrane protein
MKPFWSWAFVITAVIAIACDADDNSSSMLQQVDRDFVLNASEANLAEIQLGKLVGSRSSASAVDDFGDMMASEHQNALDELEALAIKFRTSATTRKINEYGWLPL